MNAKAGGCAENNKTQEKKKVVSGLEEEKSNPKKISVRIKKEKKKISTCHPIFLKAGRDDTARWVKSSRRD